MTSSSPWTWRVPAACAVVLLMSCGGCNERSTAQAPSASNSVGVLPPEPSISPHMEEEVPQSPLDEVWDGGRETIVWDGQTLEPGPEINQPSTTFLLPLSGKVDVTNRYPSAVLVTTEFAQGPRGFCSGVIVSRHLVLTAGHCVCQRRASSALGESLSLIDSSECAKTATVKMMAYAQVEGAPESASISGVSQRGTVLPHPQLRVILDAQGSVISSHADLALVHLDEPVDERFPPIRLADKEIQLQEFVVIVGSGYDEVARVHDRDRRYSRNQVIERLPSGGGRMRIEQPAGHHYKQDSGGPCLREDARGTTLVGISSRNLGEGESITSLYEYRDWLRGEIRRATSPKLPSHSP